MYLLPIQIQTNTQMYIHIHIHIYGGRKKNRNGPGGVHCEFYNFLQLELKTQLIGFYIVSGRQQKILGNGYRSEFLLD